MGMAKSQLPSGRNYPDKRRPRWAGKNSRPDQYRHTPPVCQLCGSRNVRAFSAIYGQGTSMSTTLRGLIFKRGYTRTRRQSVLAVQCAPPRRKPYWPTFALAILAVFLMWVSRYINITMYTNPMVTVSLIASVLNLAFAGLYNLNRYPAKMKLWGRSYFCFTCGAKSMMQ